VFARSVAVVIARPLDEVFAFVADARNRPTGLLRVLQPLIAHTTQRNLDRGFARLKSLLETGRAA
jgi:hypothetical protein